MYNNLRNTLHVPRLKGVSFETAIIERYHRRTCVVGTFPDGSSALMQVCARLLHVAGIQWGSKKYMNMKHLESVMDDTYIASWLHSAEACKQFCA